jgi:hypothetical protein
MLNQKKIYVNSQIMIFPIALFLILIYSSINIIIYTTDNSFDILRSARAICTYFIIVLFFSTNNFSIINIKKVLSLVLLLHAISIILGVIYPPVKNIILPISQYTKEFMPIRSSGFLSGYDDAGFLCNIGLILILSERSLLKKKLINIYALIYLIAASLTSRTNIAVAALILGIVYLINIKNKNFKGVRNISKYLIILVIFAGLVWVITTSFGAGLRDLLFSKFPVLNNFYILLTSSYSDYGIYTSVITKHVSIKDMNIIGMFFGIGENKTSSDIGYIKTIYSIGIIGIALQLVIFCIAITNILKLVKNNNEFSIKIMSYTFVATIFIMFIMEFKNSFIFSSTTFEMISLMYISCEITALKIKYNIADRM